MKTEGIFPPRYLHFNETPGPEFKVSKEVQMHANSSRNVVLPESLSLEGFLHPDTAGEVL